MSYSRFGWGGSDVYVFMSSRGYLDCCGCLLQEREWVDAPDHFLGGYLRKVGETVQSSFDSTQGMVDHLRRHMKAGHSVPTDVIPALLADDAENFPGGAA